jgi:hypothetical protein
MSDSEYNNEPPNIIFNWNEINADTILILTPVNNNSLQNNMSYEIAYKKESHDVWEIKTKITPLIDEIIFTKEQLIPSNNYNIRITSYKNNVQINSVSPVEYTYKVPHITNITVMFLYSVEFSSSGFTNTTVTPQIGYLSNYNVNIEVSNNDLTTSNNDVIYSGSDTTFGPGLNRKKFIDIPIAEGENYIFTHILLKTGSHDRGYLRLNEEYGLSIYIERVNFSNGTQKRFFERDLSKPTWTNNSNENYLRKSLEGSTIGNISSGTVTESGGG